MPLTADELVAGLGQPEQFRECWVVVDHDEHGTPVRCGHETGRYYQDGEARRALEEHQLARHGIGRKRIMVDPL